MSSLQSDARAVHAARSPDDREPEAAAVLRACRAGGGSARRCAARSCTGMLGPSSLTADGTAAAPRSRAPSRGRRCGCSAWRCRCRLSSSSRSRSRSPSISTGASPPSKPRSICFFSASGTQSVLASSASAFRSSGASVHGCARASGSLRASDEQLRHQPREPLEARVEPSPATGACAAGSSSRSASSSCALSAADRRLQLVRRIGDEAALQRERARPAAPATR